MDREKVHSFVRYVLDWDGARKLVFDASAGSFANSTKHLGRARDVSEFVKTGNREATIEIELQKGDRMRRNPIITRIIKKEGNKSVYTLNGQTVPGKGVQELARSMNIQIDNLCQFLPQDKVVEFAAMTPVELLQSTQRAAAAPEMLQLHEDLKKLRAHQRELLNNSRGDRESLRNLEGRQEMQRDDVERLKQRDEIKRKVAWMEKCRPIPKYQDAKTRVKAAKERKNILTAELRSLTAELAPALRRVNERQEYEIQVRKALRDGREITEKADRNAENVMKKIADLEQKLKDLASMSEAERRSIKTKKEEYKRIRGVIGRIKKQMEEEPEPFDPKAVNDKMVGSNIWLFGHPLINHRQTFLVVAGRLLTLPKRSMNS
jgi:structural maintenance of chromosomes protein 5